MTNNYASAVGGGAYDASYDMSIVNSIIWANTAGGTRDQLGSAAEFPSIRIRHCDIEESGGTGNWNLAVGVDLGGNIDADQLFHWNADDGTDGWGDKPETPLDEGSNDNPGNLSFKPKSPCIDSGHSAYAPGDFDLEGLPRILCEGVDMGAYEFGIGDYNCDRGVNLADVAGLELCFTGEGGSYLAGCEPFDADVDGDVDYHDWMGFQLDYQGFVRHCDDDHHACSGFTFIDFEGAPTGPGRPRGPIGATFADWGVIFYSIGVPRAPYFYYNAYGNDGGYASHYFTTYPPGFNIVADFVNPLFAITSDVSCAAGITVTMIAKDNKGNVLASVTSQPAPQTFWTGPISIRSEVPIASVEWWPSIPNSGVGIDNLTFWSR